MKMKDFARISENYSEVFHACLNVTGNDKKNTALLLQTTVHLEERSVYCVLVQGYKRDFKNQNIGNLQLSGFVIISEFSYRCEGDQQ